MKIKLNMGNALRTVVKKELDKISDKVIKEQEARDLLSAINCYLLIDFDLEDDDAIAQSQAELERILKIQEKLKKIVGE